MNSYKRDWSDLARDLANVFFLTGYIVLLSEWIKAGAAIYLVAECFLLPHSIKCRSWTTVIVSGVFAVASVVKLLS